MGEIITAIIMIMIALGPFPKNNKLESYQRSAAIKLANTPVSPENIIWTTGPGIKKATFTQDGAVWTAFYNWHNELLATTKPVEITALHPSAIKNLIKFYPGYQMGEILEVVGTEVIYFVNLKNNHENFVVKITSDHQVIYFKSLN